MKRKLLSLLVLLCISVSSAWADWNGGTYTVTTSENINSTINVNADATLTINAGVTMTINGSIVVADGKTLTITGGGTLEVNGVNGGNYSSGGDAIVGNVVVAGASIIATGGVGGKGIGGSDGEDGSDGGKGGPGGSGGNAFANGIVTIYSGYVSAMGGKGGQGGQGGYGGSGWTEEPGSDEEGNPTGDPIDHPAGQGGQGGDGGDGGNAFNSTVIFYGGSVDALGGEGGDGGDGGYGEGGNGDGGCPGGFAYAFSGDNVTFETMNYYMSCYDYNGIGYKKNENTKVSGNARVEISAEDAVCILMTANLAGGAYWTTFYSNTGNFIAPEGTQVFAVNLTGTTLTMTEIEDRIVKSGEGVVLKKAGSGDATTTIIMAETESTATGDFSANSLTGTTTSITNPGNAYVLNYKAATGVGFYKLKASGTIGANKAFLTYPASAREFFLFDETTSISEELRVKGEEFASAVVFDLQGRRVQNPTKGLYIVNGKKVFINK